MASECDNEETVDSVETEEADIDDKTETVSSVSELIPRHNAISAIWQFFLVSSLLIIKLGMTRFADTAILNTYPVTAFHPHKF